MHTIPVRPTEAEAFGKEFYYQGHKVRVLTTHKPTCTVVYLKTKQVNIVELARLEKML